MARGSSKSSASAKSWVTKAALFLTVFVGLFLISAVHAPQVMAWPYKAQFGDNTVYSEQPIAPDMAVVIAKADALVRRSAIYDPDGYATDIFLSNGGWRWKLATIGASSNLAISRPINNAIIVNSPNAEMDGAPDYVRADRRRSLSSLIAHERTHGLISSHFGLVKAVLLPTVKVEGYCDYVAQESTLSDAAYAEKKRTGARHRAMLYYEGRKLAEDALDHRKLSVDDFFAGK